MLVLAYLARAEEWLTQVVCKVITAIVAITVIVVTYVTAVIVAVATDAMIPIVIVPSNVSKLNGM